MSHRPCPGPGPADAAVLQLPAPRAHRVLHDLGAVARAAGGRARGVPGHDRTAAGASADVREEDSGATGFGAPALHNSAMRDALPNLLLLVPLGVHLRHHFRRGPAFAAAAGLGASLLFEITQVTGVLVLYERPHRLFDVDDPVINTSGAVVAGRSRAASPGGCPRWRRSTSAPGPGGLIGTWPEPRPDRARDPRQEGNQRPRAPFTATT